jgi:hypothetical protein
MAVNMILDQRSSKKSHDLRSMILNLSVSACHYVFLTSSCSWGVNSQNTAVFANFVQFHYAAPAIGHQHITSFITGVA